MKKTPLPNRYGDKNFLKETSPGRYVLTLESQTCLRYGVNEDGTYTFVDPPGGPFMCVGHKVPGIEGVLDKIEQIKGTGTVLTFKQ